MDSKILKISIHERLAHRQEVQSKTSIRDNANQPDEKNSCIASSFENGIAASFFFAMTKIWNEN
ncbi:hypothetical protein KIN20_005897 [Parelaphostrongylus tenuis]|uniref:Uncharacterized protein n=1 Tax=Parelaphostrongylus tenuis TaxID=148309 RepID=A0AAD5QHV4_PARTN|nr:hypothetical protein KIN20_005897 [Parelaphostrongylus tenuis]